MPELPDITVYIERLEALIVAKPLQQLDVRNIFVLRSVSPSPSDLAGRIVIGIRRMGKRIVIAFERELFAVHLVAGESGLAAFDRGGLEVLGSSSTAFGERLTAQAMHFPKK